MAPAPICALLALALAGVVHPASAQQPDSANRRAQVAGAVTVTSKGISLIPALTLGKPAAIEPLCGVSLVTFGDLRKSLQ